MGHRLSKVLVRPSPIPSPSIAVLRALIRKLCAYEPDLVCMVHRMVVGDGCGEQHRVGDTVFAQFTMLTEVVLPRSIVDVGSDAFFGCTRLGKVS